MKTYLSKIAAILCCFNLVLSCTADTDLLFDSVTSSKEEEAMVTGVRAKNPLIASAIPNITSGEAPLEVIFQGAVSSQGKSIVTYFWDFKDGTTNNEVNPTHVFENPGVYLVEFTVTHKNGTKSTVNSTITVSEPANNEEEEVESSYPTNAVFASSYGFDADDATEAFKDALNSGNSFIVIDKQTTDWIIQPTKLYDLTNMTIVFEPGVKLRAKSGAFTSQNSILFNLVRPKNLVIIGNDAEFVMNKTEYTDGEGRHAIAIKGGDGVILKGLTLRDSGGDGIYLAGSSTTGSYSKNIVIEDVVSTNNRRQGMSIISAQDVWVRNSEFTKSNGTSPEAGVDLEPNNAEERLVNINFSNCKFSNNNSSGFVVGPGKLNSSSIPISIRVIDSEFSNNTVSPENSRAIRTEMLLGQGIHDDPVKGSVQFERITFRGSKYRIVYGKTAADSYTVSFKDSKAYNVANSGTGSVIELQYSSVENTLGGFQFGDFYLEYSTNVPFMKILAPNTAGFIVKDVNGDFRIKEPFDNPIQYTGGYNPVSNSNVNIIYQHIN